MRYRFNPNLEHRVSNKVNKVTLAEEHTQNISSAEKNNADRSVVRTNCAILALANLLARVCDGM